MSKREKDQVVRSGSVPAPGGVPPSEPAEEWLDEADEKGTSGATGRGSGDAEGDWAEDEPILPATAKRNESPAWVSWAAGVAGLLFGLLLFRSC